MGRTRKEKEDDGPASKAPVAKPKATKAAGKKGKKDKPKDFDKMNLVEWEEARMKTDPYLSPRENLADSRFWNKEQATIFKAIIETKSTEVVDQKHVNFEYIEEFDYQFGSLIEVCENLGIRKIMEFEQPYNLEVVKQFYATVFFVGDRDKTIKWMSGDEMLSAPFMEFVKAMNYEEDYRVNRGVVCYGAGNVPGKMNLKGHYPKGT